MAVTGVLDKILMDRYHIFCFMYCIAGHLIVDLNVVNEYIYSLVMVIRPTEAILAMKWEGIWKSVSFCKN